MWVLCFISIVVASRYVLVVSGDYICICSNGQRNDICDSMSANTTIVGHLENNSCAIQANYVLDKRTKAWYAIIFHDQVRFVHKGSFTELRRCIGNQLGHSGTPPTMTDAATASSPSMSTTVTTVTTSAPTMSTTATAITTSAPTMYTTATAVTLSAPTMSTTATAVTKSAQSMSTTAASTHSGTYAVLNVIKAPNESFSTGVHYGCASAVFSHAASHHGKLFNIRQTCYELVTVNKSWSSAESDCKSRGGHLVHIANDEQQNTIYQVVRQYHDENVWIGLNDKIREEHFVWSSGDPVNYTHWYPGRIASTHQSDEDCVAIWIAHGGQWEDVLCSGSQAINLGYVCEFDSVDGAATTINPDALINTDGNTQSCPHRTTAIVAQFGKSCYALYRNLEVWSKAEQTCKQSGGHLVHINDDPEQQFIEGFMRRHNQITPAWIGLSDTSVEGRFVWTDGVSASYTNWLPGHVTHGNTEDCVALLPNSNGTWDDFRCERNSLFSTLGDHHHPLCEYAHTIASVLVG
ncbi:lymphocyte antigen 75-like isoform X2 [Dreissena polymorpha]|nr:lymphocyte antigen 75-like isoform X2 [Dreissena polymorpha]